MGHSSGAGFAQAATVTGWASYIDDDHTQGSPLVLPDGQKTTLTNNAASTRLDQKPADIGTWWDPNTSKILSGYGEALGITVNFQAVPVVASGSFVEFGLTIGSGGSAVDIYDNILLTFPKGNGVPQWALRSFVGYSYNTWAQTGATPWLRAGGTNVSVYNYELRLFRIHKSNT